MRGSAWRLYLGAGAIATGVYYLLPPGPRAVLNVVVGASAVAAIAAGIAWHRPARRLAWWLIAAAQGLFVAGDALFSINELVLQIEPFPSLADALCLPSYPVLAAGLALLTLSRSAGRDVAGVIDATFAADMVFSVLALRGASTTVTDGGYLAAYLLLGASALHPSLPKLSETVLAPPGPPGPRPAAGHGGGRPGRPGPAHLPVAGRDRPPGGGDRWCLDGAVRPGHDPDGRARAGDRAVRGRAPAPARPDHARRRAGADRIAAELHDGPIQRLSVLSYDLERAKQRMLANPAAVARLEHAQAELASEVQGLRELMMSLRPPTLDEVGLEAALRDQVGAFTRHSGIDCSVRVALSGRLDNELETIVYRVTQEALLNVTRPAQATRLWLELEGSATGCSCASATTGSASTPGTGPTWSARVTSAWSPCGNGSSWPAAASSSSPARAPARSCGRPSPSHRRPSSRA